MKICLAVHCYYPDHFYGTEAYTHAVARELQARGHKVVVLTASFAGEHPADPLLIRYQHEGIDVIRLNRSHRPHRQLRDTYLMPDLLAIQRQILSEEQPDLLHVTHLINHTATLLQAADSCSIPVVATFTDFFGFCFNNKLQDSRGRLCTGPSSSRANCVACYLQARVGASPASWAGLLQPLLAVSARILCALEALPGLHRWQRLAFVKALRERPQRLADAYCSYRCAMFPTRFLEDAYRRNGYSGPGVFSRFGMDLDRNDSAPAVSTPRLRIGYIGQMAPHKGVDLLVRAFAALKPGSAACALELVLYGPEQQDPGYSRRLRGLAREASVRFAGTFEAARTAEILSEIDLLVVPSRWTENSPLVLLAALACHCPVVVSDVAGLTELLRDGENGFRFACGDWRALRMVLQRFLDDPGLATRMKTTTHYSRTTSTMVDELENVYQRALA